MFDKIRLTIILSAIVCGATTAALAEIIHLTSGQTVEGRIVERTADEIKVDTGIGVLVTYYLDEVKEISSNAGSPQNVLPVTDEPKADETIPSTPLDAGQVTSVNSALPPLSSIDFDAKSREEHFLLHQYKKTAQEMAQQTDPSTLPPPPMDKEHYLQKQLTEKQALLKKEISQGIRLVNKKFAEGIKTFLKNKPQFEETQKTKPLPSYFPAAFIAIFISFYVFACYPWMMIARKLGLAGWMAWVPIIQIFLLFKMANRPLWWILFLLIPVVNILIPIKLWMDIAKRFNKSILLGILMIVPILNLLILWYIAFSPVAEE